MSDELDCSDISAAVISKAPHGSTQQRDLPDLQITMPLNPLDITIKSGGREQHQIAPARLPFIIPAETPYSTNYSTEGRNDTRIHIFSVFVRRHVLAEVAAELFTFKRIVGRPPAQYRRMV